MIPMASPSSWSCRTEYSSLLGFVLAGPKHGLTQSRAHPEELVVHRERYNDGSPAEGLAVYENVLSEYHRHRGRDPDEPWAERVAKQFSTPKREKLLEILKGRGFGFD